MRRENPIGLEDSSCRIWFPCQCSFILEPGSRTCVWETFNTEASYAPTPHRIWSNTSCENKRRLHTDRITGRYIRNCHVGGSAVASVRSGQEPGASHRLCQQPETTRPGKLDVSR